MPPITEFLADATAAELIGVLGFAFYVVSYALLTLGRISSDDAGYYGMNVAAATCVLIGLTAHFNLAAALIQVFWLLISAIGIAVRVLRRKPRAIA